MKNLQSQINLPIFEFIWVFISTLVLTSILTLTFNIFSPALVLVISMIFCALLWYLKKINVVVKDIRFDWIIIGIALFALVIRLGPWLYLEGGQDQGVYVAMSKQFELNGGLKYEDNLYGLLKPELQEKYLKEEGWFSLGMVKNKLTDSNEVMTNFYPAHPALMSLFGYVLGDENRVFSLTLFAVLSVIGAYLLVLELTKSRVAGYVAAGLIAISPLHLYFSRFPTTEIMTLALNISSLYFLLKARNTGNYVYLVLNILLVNVILYTRLTWIISLPFYIFAVFAFLTYAKDRGEYKGWGIYGITIIVSFLISTLFYYTQIPFLYKHFYSDIFKYIPENIFYVLLISLPFITYFLTTKWNEQTRKVLTFIYEKRIWIFSLALIALLLISFKNFYVMNFTDRYLGTRYDYFWGMARGGWVVFKDMAISSLIMYITPFGILGLVLSLKSLNTPEKSLLFFFLLLYTGFHFYIVKYTPYHFYYARYQLSEIVPFALIFIAIFCVDHIRTHKILSYFVLIPIVIYSLIYIPFMYQGQVGTKPEMFKKIVSHTTQDDIVIFYNPLDWADNFIFSPLKYYYDLNAMNVNELANVYEFGSKIKDYDADDVWILSTVPLNDPKFFLVDTLKFEKGYFANAKEDKPPLKNEINDWKIPYCDRVIPEIFCSGAIPIKYHKAVLDIYLYNYR